MRRNNIWLACILVAAQVFASCYYHRPDYSDDWDMTEWRRDSLDFEATHHYTENFNFLVVGDSLPLWQGHPSVIGEGVIAEADSEWVYRDDRLVVADIVIVPRDSVDSVWVKVARDQLTMGWVREGDMLRQTIPDSPISLFIHVFSNSHLIYFLSVMGVLLVVYLFNRMRRKRFHMVHFDDVGSCYPTLLCLTISGAATLYASMQNFVPDTWLEFYFHPTLNPFGLPFVLGLFVAAVWLIVLLAVASADDVLRMLPLRDALAYLLSLAGVCAGCYLFFSVATLYYVGYPCLLLYAAWALRRYFLHARCHFVCGQCGAKMRAKGRCPRCGVWNE